MLASCSGPRKSTGKAQLPLSFSTLGCPDWDLDKIISFATENGYSGIEVRGLLHEMDLPSSAVFSNTASISSVLKKMKSNNLRFIGLGSSSTLHFPEGKERTKNLEDGRRFIELAAKLECPYVRVFPNKFIDGQTKERTMELIANGLKELGDFAKDFNVTVLMETHGDLVYADDIVNVMTAANHPNTGLVWDIANMWTITKEPPGEVYKKLRPWIKHTHLKDATLANDKLSYTLLGKGEVPIFDAIDLLMKDNYKGYYSFEWEKLWHPEIAEPEIALADFSKTMRKHIPKS